MRLTLRQKSLSVFFETQKRQYSSARSAAIARCTLTVAGRQPSQASVVEQLNHGLRSSGATSSHRQGAAVLTATPEFTRWLEDQDFISKVLGVLRSRTHDFSSVDLLSGVVDGLGVLREPRNAREGSAEKHLVQRGISILYSPWTDVLLPKLWREAEAVTAEAMDDPDRASAITFAMTPEGEDRHVRRTSNSWEVTLPLANTVFQNGRRSTLFASHWTAGAHPGKSTRLMKMVEKRHQDVHTSDSATIGFHIPLLPLTPSRRIVAGLGNIVRQVEVDGTVTPASKELELLIPKLSERRSKEGQAIERGPIGIWAWVIPPQVVESGMLEEINETFAGQPRIPESDLASKAAPVFDQLIQHGCRLHKILSGGGGWGAKQGLLSLDPETTCPIVENEDAEVERFIKAFEHRGDRVQPDGLVTPGSYMLFCTEPNQAQHVRGRSRHDISSPERTGLILGVAPEMDQSHADNLEGESTMKLYDSQFGASSSTGLYLQKESFTTKIDVPGTVLVQGAELGASKMGRVGATGFMSSQ